MKSRLPSAPLTDEDSRIWWGQHFVRPFRVLQLMAVSIASDRRDADLMLSLREARRLFRDYGYDHGLLTSNTVIREIADLSSPDPSNWYYGGVPLPRLIVTMKPRLRPQALTEEDQCIWQVNRRHDWLLWARLSDDFRKSERRDADLMLHSLLNRLIPIGIDPDTELNLWWQL